MSAVSLRREPERRIRAGCFYCNGQIPFNTGVPINVDGHVMRVHLSCRNDRARKQLAAAQGGKELP